MNPIHFGPPSGDVCQSDQQPHAAPMPFRLRIDQVAVMDHDDMMAGHCEPRRRDDDKRGKRRWFEGSKDDRRGDPRVNKRPVRRDDRDYRRSGKVDDIVRYNKPRDDDDGGGRAVRYRGNERRDDHYDRREVAPKKDHSGLLASLRNTVVGIGGIAGLGGGLAMSGMGVLNLMHNARTSPSMMLILGGAALALVGFVALKTVFEEH